MSYNLGAISAGQLVVVLDRNDPSRCYQFAGDGSPSSVAFNVPPAFSQCAMIGTVINGVAYAMVPWLPDPSLDYPIRIYAAGSTAFGDSHSDTVARPPYIDPPLTLPSYLTVSAASILAAQLIAPSSWSSDDAAQQLQWLCVASQSIDAAMPYQGRKFSRAQLLEFPRVEGTAAAYPEAILIQLLRTEPFPRLAEDVHDWNVQSQSAVAPLCVQMATLVQAFAESTGSIAARRDRELSRLIAEATGSLSEQYAAPTGKSEDLLCSEARAIMQQYHLRSGRSL